VIYQEALMTAHLTVEQRRLARRLHAKGLSLREIGRQVGCSHEVVRTVVRRESKRPVRSQPWQPGPGRLTLADREEISLGLRDDDSFTAIALSLGKSRLDHLPRSGRQRRPRRLPRLACPPTGSRAGSSSQAGQVEPAAAGGPGYDVASTVVVAAGDRRPVAVGVRRRSSSPDKASMAGKAVAQPISSGVA
jgi:Helix-turn-helix domain